jgi:hypothetical protein
MFRLYNSVVYYSLKDKGVVPNKSKISKLNVFEFVPNKLINHFIRGWFDGDGSIIIHKKNLTSSINMAGTYGNLNEIQKIFLENVKCLNPTKIYKDKSIFSLKWGGNNQVINIRKWLYKDANIFMDRKKRKFDEVRIKERKGSSKYRGVSWSKTRKKWIASIGNNGKMYNLGGFDTEKEAAKSYNDAIIKFGKSLNYRNILK